MIAQRATAILLFLCGIGLAAFSASQASGELAPYLMGGVRPEQRYSSILSGQVTPAASRWSRDLFALDCLDVPRTVYGLLQERRVGRHRLPDRVMVIAAGNRVEDGAITGETSAESPTHALNMIR